MAVKRAAGEGTFWKRDGRWYGKRRIGPREATVTINASGTTRAEAAANLRARVDQRLRGGQAPIDASVTLEAYLRWWVDEELAQRVADGVIVETSRKQYADRVRFQIVPLLGGIPLRDLSAMHLRQWMTTLGRQGASPSLRRHALSVLNNALERAVRYEVIPGNPAKLVYPPAVHRERRAEITLETARTLLRPTPCSGLPASTPQ